MQDIQNHLSPSYSAEISVNPEFKKPPTSNAPSPLTHNSPLTHFSKENMKSTPKISVENPLMRSASTAVNFDYNDIVARSTDMSEMSESFSVDTLPGCDEYPPPLDIELAPNVSAIKRYSAKNNQKITQLNSGEKTKNTFQGTQTENFTTADALNFSEAEKVEKTVNSQKTKETEKKPVIHSLQEGRSTKTTGKVTQGSKFSYTPPKRPQSSNEEKTTTKHPSRIPEKTTVPKTMQIISFEEKITKSTKQSPPKGIESKISSKNEKPPKNEIPPKTRIGQNIPKEMESKKANPSSSKREAAPTKAKGKQNEGNQVSIQSFTKKSIQNSFNEKVQSGSAKGAQIKSTMSNSTEENANKTIQGSPPKVKEPKDPVQTPPKVQRIRKSCEGSPGKTGERKNMPPSPPFEVQSPRNTEEFLMYQPKKVVKQTPGRLTKLMNDSCHKKEVPQREEQVPSMQKNFHNLPEFYTEVSAFKNSNHIRINSSPN